MHVNHWLGTTSSSCKMKLIFVSFVLLSIAYHCSYAESEPEAVVGEELESDSDESVSNEFISDESVSNEFISDESLDIDDSDVDSLEETRWVNDYVKIAVQEHNKYRSRHGSPNVHSGSPKLHNYAQRWAQKLVVKNDLVHSKGPYGENLYIKWGGSKDKKVIMQEAVKDWYNEIKNYDFNNPGFRSNTGHFTQVVWKASRDIGVGIAIAPDDDYGHRAVVCVNYQPAGNVLGAFDKNVLPRQ